jgi:hypothetical protein
MLQVAISSLFAPVVEGVERSGKLQSLSKEHFLLAASGS